ncbi:MAG TPA: 2'-5' RNA ligase family protein [Terriglobia bacterium]|nr:2'-5' RNA ligase family protein [Terriglobia bacterium]
MSLPAPDQIDASVCARLSRVCAAQAPIDYRLAEISQFDDGVLYLAADPGAPFRRLTQAVWRRFPETPPYAGRHADIVPHLSVAWPRDAVSLQQIERDFTAAAAGHLPITARATSLALFDNATGRWERRHSFPFVA